jgi:hypothetical protein
MGRAWFSADIRFAESAPLDWRRGMFRLWLLVSAAWIMGWAIYLILSAIAQALTSPEDFLAIPIVFFGPPIALLLCGLAATWAVRGFKFREPEQKITTKGEETVVRLRQEFPDDYVS